MGHISHQAAKRLVEQKIVLGIELDKESLPMFCQTCAKAKPTRKPILKERANSPARQLGDKIHSDVWGPTTPTSYNAKSYYVSFTDDHTHWSMVKCITKKSDVVSRYKDYEAWMDTQHSCKIKILQSDCGGKYLSDDFNAYLKRKGTVRHLTVHDTPEENGVAEHLNRTLLEHTHAMIIAANLPKNLWPEAIHHAVWLKNRTSTRALNGKTPYEMLFGVKLNLRGLPEWGARILVMTQAASKLDARSEEARWVGYSGTSQGHHVYRPSTHRISVERNVTFEGEVLLPPVVLDVAPIVGE